MARVVRMSPAVERVLGPQMALHARGITEGTCPHATGPSNTTGPSTPPSSIWRPPLRQSLVQPADGHDMTMTATLVDNLPVLVARMPTVALTNSGTHGATEPSCAASSCKPCWRTAST